MKKNRIIGILLLLVLKVFLPGLDPNKRINQYLIDIWTNKNGLPQSYVLAITQTKQGYIWIGTQEGVVRFDGVRMMTFNSKNIPEFKSSMITCLLEDEQENLWIGTMNGLMRYKDGKFKLFTEEDGLAYNMVRCFAVDEKGCLWIGTDKGICKYKDGVFSKFKIENKGHSNYINSIVIDTDKRLIIATKDEIYKLKDGRFISFRQQDNFKSEISTLYSDHKNNLWIGTINDGLYKYSNKKLSEFSGNDQLSGHYISSIIEDRSGCLWIGTQNGGLNRVYNNKISSFTERDGLPSNALLYLFEDREENLWIGASISGLNRLRDGKVTVYGPSDGIISEDIRTVFEDSRDVLWVGGGDAGLYKKQEDLFTGIRGIGLLKRNVIRSLMEDPDGNIWVGTIGGGLYIVKNNSLERFIPGLTLPSNRIFAIFRSSNDIMWVGTGAGISKFVKGKFKNYISVDGRKLNTVRVIAEDRLGNIWFAVEGMGMARFDNDNISFIKKKKSLSSNIITCLYFDDDNIAWIGTYGGGLNWIKDDLIYSVTDRDGLANNSAYTIIEDAGKLWMSSNDGIYNVYKKELIEFGEKKIERISCTTFNESSGMKNRECNGGNYPVAWKDRNGILWFPNVQGLVKIDPNNIKPDDDFPGLVIEKMLIDEKEQDIKQNNIIPPGYKRIEFRYTALDFNNPRDIKFRVRLKGVEKDWINMGTSRKTYYTLIPPGKYTFEVISTNGEGRWNDVPKSLEINLQPFFYQTLTFYIFVLIFLIMIIAILIRWRFRSLNKRKIELELEVKNRTQEIRHKNIELEKLSIVARETNNGVFITSATGKIEWVNEGFVRMFGYTLEQLIQTMGDNVKNFSLRKDFKEIFKQCLDGREPMLYESLNKTRMGKSIWTQTELTPILNEQGEVKKLIFVETDISQLKQAYDKMKEMSLTDPLTKLKNRRYFHNLIERDVQISRRKLYKKSKEGLNYSMLFLMVDIDFFKKVNDEYGHKAGDQLLIQVSNRMRETLRVSDLLVRWGGEEFLIMTKDDNIEGARQLSVRLLKAIEDEVFYLDDSKVDITISIGFCGFPIMKQNPIQFGWEDIVHLADSALYIAKNSGRKRSAGVKIINGEMADIDLDLIKSNFDQAIEKGIIEVIISTKDS